MVAYNHVVVIGSLTRDPDIKTIGKTSMKLARLSVCINERRKTQDGKLVDNPIFVDVEAWARLAEICEKYLSKNSSIFVEGKLQMAQWEKDGVKHQKIKIRASNIKFLTKPRKGADGKAKSRKGSEQAEPEIQQYADNETFVPGEADTATDDDFAETISNW